MSTYRKTAPTDPPEKPHAHWDKVVSAAYLRIIGHTQRDAAIGVGRSLRSIQSWEADSELWALARAAARDRWFSNVTDVARATVLKGAAKDPDLSLRLLERIDPDLAPRSKHEITGTDGGPVEVAVTRRIVRAGDADD